jgi:ATP synthase protein I
VDDLPHAESEPPSGPEPVKPLPGLAAFAGMGVSIAVTVGIGVWLGILADEHFHTAPTFLLVGLAVGVTCAVISVVSLVKRYL